MVDYAKYLKNLPVIPDVAAKVLSVAEDKLDISFRDLENTIKLDPGLSAKILKVAKCALRSPEGDHESADGYNTLGIQEHKESRAVGDSLQHVYPNRSEWIL